MAVGGVAAEQWREEVQCPSSLPVLNSLMKFRSEEQRRKHSHIAFAVFTCLFVLLRQPIVASLCPSPCRNSSLKCGLRNCLTFSVMWCLLRTERRRHKEKMSSADNNAYCRHQCLAVEKDWVDGRRIMQPEYKVEFHAWHQTS